MNGKNKRLASALVIGLTGLSLLSGSVYAKKNGHHDDDDDDNHRKVCRGLPGHGALQAALNTALSASAVGLDNNMWATIVNRDGIVCAVAFSGGNRTQQWLLSRVISAQKANTANGLSLDPSASQGTKIAISTANLFTAVNPGGGFYGLQHSNPVDGEPAYQGNPKKFGRPNDPMVGEKVGGVNVFGGGLALYNTDGIRVGGVGVSGDLACADHVTAWRLRHALNRDNVPGGVAAGTDNVIYDLVSIEAAPGLTPPTVNTGGFNSLSGFGHPTCGGDVDATDPSLVNDGDAESVGLALPLTHPVGPAP